MPGRRRREYLQLLDAAKIASEQAIDAFNRVRNPYRNEAALLFLGNAWELLAKAVLVQNHQSIVKGHRGETIAGAVAVRRLGDRGFLDASQVATIQQVLSLRHAAAHHLLPPVPDEVMHHLLFFGCKFFRELVARVFPRHSKDLSGSYLSLSYSNLTTYADKVARAVSRARRSPSDERLVWLLERGIEFDGTNYLTERQVRAKYRGKKKVMPHLALGDFVRRADMVRIVPLEAPRNFTADVTLRRGSARDASLPIVVQKTEVELDYPYLTRELGERLGTNQSWVARAATVLRLKGDAKYHQQVRASRSSYVHRYSDAAYQRLSDHIAKNPSWNPFRS